MNYRMIAFTVGRILLVEAALLLLPLAVALGYDESTTPFAAPIILLLAAGVLLSGSKPRQTVLYARDGFAVVALAWLLMSAFGALPFVISGDIPNYVDAFFETVSGFTTTGATLLKDVESLSRSGLLWRSFTHWVGGMGVLVFVMAVIPMTDARGMHLLRAEMPGPTAGKLVSRMSDTAKILYGIYFAMTVVLTILLLLGGMNLYDAAIHAFGTAGTGGFSNRAASVGAYNSLYLEVVIGIFMLLFGINFNLYYFLLVRRFRDVFRSEELQVYLGVVVAAVALITLDITRVYGTVGPALRSAFFQVASVITTTGYATADFNLWPSFSQGVILILMFIGGCAGSTGGGFKVVRVVTLIKSSINDLKRMLHPNAVLTVRVEGKPLSDRGVRRVQTYLALYTMLVAASFLLLCLEGFDLITTFTAVFTCINNVGPGLGMVGPSGNFAAFSVGGKLLLAFDMLVGRLEIFPMILLFAPSIWKRGVVRGRGSRE